MEYANISSPLPNVETLTYRVPGLLQAECKVGCRVRVPLGARQVTGVVLELHKENPQPQTKLREIISVLDKEPVIDNERILLSKFISRYYFAPLHDCIKLCLPPDTVNNHKLRYALSGLGKKDVFLRELFGRKRILEHKQLISLGVPFERIQQFIAEGLFEDVTVEKKHNEFEISPFEKGGPRGIYLSANSEIPLNSPFSKAEIIEHTEDQKNALEVILNNPSNSFLLQGPCGSGKTEVYAHVARHMLEQKKGVLILLPEISLTPQLHRYFSSRLSAEIVMLHSGLSAKERNESYYKLLRGEVSVVLGARSAVFSPIQNLGLIVVDEEHDQSYKQDDSPRYHARDVALWRAHQCSAKIILGSATPSLETMLNAQRKKFVHVQLSERINKTLPIVRIVDLRTRSLHKHTKIADKAQSDGQSLCIISAPLREAIAKTLDNKQQAMILLNRRGYAAFALCTSCGEVVRCAACSVSLTYHKKTNLLRCHQCDHMEYLDSSCKKCSGAIVTLGLGTERVEQELRQLFPTANIARLDRDTATTHTKLLNTLQSMRDRSTDILVGTQMIAKGHDFPNVSLVGVVLAETGLAVPDFRASERTFQLMVQVAGRAGRAQTSGTVIIQTFNPDHPSLKLAQHQDTQAFVNLEMPMRQGALLPPYSYAALVRVEGAREADVQRYIQVIAQICKLYEQNHAMKILGPAPCPIEKIRGKIRHQLALYFYSRRERMECLNLLTKNSDFLNISKNNKCKVTIDIDPLRMM